MERRNTPTKQAVLELLVKSGKAMSREAIEKEITQNINRATIYRVLNRFCEDDVLHRIVAEDGKQYFAVCVNCYDKVLSGHHFHFRCVKCDTIECLPIAVEFSISNSYQVDNVNCVLSGTCKDCSV
ncbi:hypothetical protein NBRC110019_30130 [Neptunitalea chrysea]|uniref:Fur family transcriptional regulator, ferric uptake regulator n=1 Tax=Neptunitalea chrysea TaxID=1647581 RepID=A0A9W6B8J3_9FLAO|nr:transcriptional repressor [Neptunitalea chrysea]GLB53972.1 hypothetical protein NBRC110019_30130 [Neptunitalea chrysea]